jgi:hypothetical protein
MAYFAALTPYVFAHFDRSAAGPVLAGVLRDQGAGRAGRDVRGADAGLALHHRTRLPAAGGVRRSGAALRRQLGHRAESLDPARRRAHRLQPQPIDAVIPCPGCLRTFELRYTPVGSERGNSGTSSDETRRWHAEAYIHAREAAARPVHECGLTCPHILVETRGLEPLTPALQRRCSAS